MAMKGMQERQHTQSGQKPGLAHVDFARISAGRNTYEITHRTAGVTGWLHQKNKEVIAFTGLLLSRQKNKPTSRSPGG